MSDLPARLPIPPNCPVDPRSWHVLTEAIWPSAKSAGAVLLALEYCKARKLDPFKRPVHIVPVWNAKLGREVETVWPGINELQTTASRTGAWAGMDPPEWGPLRRQQFKGASGQGQDRRDHNIEVTYPEWCSVTVYKLVAGQRCAYTEPVFWEEAYARIGKTAVPNDMWARRPRGQLLKVAKAASLRAAFPEESDGPTAEEMEGQAIEHGGVTIDAEPSRGKPAAELTPISPSLPSVPATPPKTFGAALDAIAAEVEAAPDTDALTALQRSERLAKLRSVAAGKSLERLNDIDNRLAYRLAALRLAEAEPDPAAPLMPADDAWPGAAP